MIGVPAYLFSGVSKQSCKVNLCSQPARSPTLKTCQSFSSLSSGITSAGRAMILDSSAHSGYTPRSLSPLSCLTVSLQALVHMTLVFSYTLLTLSVLASSPPIRRALSRIRQGPLVFNGSWLLVSTAMLAALVPFGLRHGDAMRDISRDYNAASDLLQVVSTSGDMTQLANLPSILQSLGKYL